MSRIFDFSDAVPQQTPGTARSDSCEIFSTIAIAVQNFISLMVGQTPHVIATKSALLES